MAKRATRRPKRKPLIPSYPNGYWSFTYIQNQRDLTHPCVVVPAGPADWFNARNEAARQFTVMLGVCVCPQDIHQFEHVIPH